MFNEQRAVSVFEIGIKIIQTFNGTRPVVVGEGKEVELRAHRDWPSRIIEGNFDVIKLADNPRLR